MQPRKLQCFIWRGSIKPILRFSWFCSPRQSCLTSIIRRGDCVRMRGECWILIKTGVSTNGISADRDAPFFLFVCHYWQWPILISCVMCYYLCVLTWLMRPILALNCLLQVQQERSEEESSVGDALALASRCERFCSASLILFASYSPAPLFIRPRHFVRSCAICSHDSVGMLKSLRETLRVSLYRFFWPPWERFPA